ncbi:hypothetical protein H4R20_007121, partial [Coemansia guatemalensis]
MTLNLELRAPARVLANSTAPNIVAEVTQDILTRWSTRSFEAAHAQELLRLGQYVATFRVQAAREAVLVQQQEEKARAQQRNFVDRTA